MFKVCGGVNSRPGTVNYDLYQFALRCTASRMVPTYLLMDSAVNRDCDPAWPNIMGCRARVYDNAAGEAGTVRWGNIAYTSINLPRIALSCPDGRGFDQRLRQLMETVCRLMGIRNDWIAGTGGKYVEYVLREDLWRGMSSLEDSLRQGTYSIGFIGLSETVELLTGEKMFQSQRGKELAENIVKTMNDFVMERRRRAGMNFSLLDTPGEMMSGSFCQLDRERFPNPIQEKGFYTNSFHADVDAGLSVFEKLAFEAPFHGLCSGGSISICGVFLRDGIQCFLDGTDPKILARGRDYYRLGQVGRIEWNGSCVSAEVSGSGVEPYLVNIDFTVGGEVESWSCDCPYDWGDVCKHVVAVLLALQSEPAELLWKRDGAGKPTVRDLVERAGKEELAELVLERCQEDKRFRNQVLSKLEDTGEQELTAIKELVKESIWSNTSRGYIDEAGCDNICADLDDALDQARRRIGRGQYGRALDIAQFVLLTGMKLAGEADSSSGSLGWTVDAALETVGLAANSLVESGDARGEWVERLLETAQDSVFDGWEEWRFDFLGRAAVLAEPQSEEAFYWVLDRLNDKRWEKFEDAPSYGKREKLVRYRVARAARGKAAGRAYLKQNLDVDEQRLILTREYMEERNYAGAEGLCRERLDQGSTKWWSRPDQWQHLLYEI